MTLCREAEEYQVAAACIPPNYVGPAAATFPRLNICTVIGFPNGYSTTAVKVFETKDAVANGASEIDMVINIGALKAGNNEEVYKDIRAVVEAACGVLVKVIIETCYLTDDEKVTACKMAAKAGADFVKTSTGFGTGGANPHDVALMKKSIPASMSVKASGGMHSWDDAKANIEAGADRLGVSASLAILDSYNE